MNTYFDSRFLYAEDYDFWERISNLCHVSNVPEVLNLYRIHGRQTSSTLRQTAYSAVWPIQQRQLEKLCVCPSEEEKMVHLKIGVGWTYEVSKKAVHESERWLSRLKQANTKRRIYPEPAFSEVLAERWHHCCSSATQLGWWTWKRWVQSDLSDTGKNTKMAIKCMLRWDPVRRKAFAKPHAFKQDNQKIDQPVSHNLPDRGGANEEK